MFWCLFHWTNNYTGKSGNQLKRIRCFVSSFDHPLIYLCMWMTWMTNKEFESLIEAEMTLQKTRLLVLLWSSAWAARMDNWFGWLWMVEVVWSQLDEQVIGQTGSFRYDKTTSYASSFMWKILTKEWIWLLK